MGFDGTLRQLPLLTAFIWYAVVAFQAYRGRTHTWTERFFLLGFFFGGTYALSDWLFFGFEVQDPTADPQSLAFYEQALLIARVDLASLTLSILFLFLFTRVFLERMSTTYLITVLPTAIFLALTWTDAPDLRLIDGLENSGAGYFLVTFNGPILGLWLLYVLAYTFTGSFFMYRTYRIVIRQSRSLARKTLGILAVFLIAILFGISTNMYFAIANVRILPLFSTFLAIPGVLTLAALAPITRERLSEAMRRFKARRYTIRSAYLIYRDGTLIASRSHLGAEEVDRDLFSATLDVIENFMRTSFPLLRGKWLRTIEHGNLRIVIERGRHAYLALVIDGEENDLLRRQMRDELVQFERTNADVLPAWRGIQEDARDTDALFEHLFEPAPVF